MNLKEMLKHHEGFRLKPYKDTVGKLTIAVGRDLDDRGLLETEVDFMLDNDIAYFRSECQKYPWFEKLDPVRQDVLIDMMFNLGPKGFSHFTHFISFLSQEMYPAAAAEMLNSHWAKQVGRRAQELSALMLEGDYARVFKG